MRRLTYEDNKGRKFLVEVPDNAPDSHAKMGVRVGPPDLSSLDLPVKMEVALNNQLFDRGLITRNDIRFRMQELLASLQAAFAIDVQTLEALYHKEN